MSAKHTVKAKESYLCGGTKPTKQWSKNTKDGGWVLMKNLAPFCHLFCSCEQFFLRDKPTPTHFLQILDLPPPPRAVQLGIQRGIPAPFQLTVCTGSPPWDNTRRGSNYPASEIQLSASLWRVNTSSALMTKFKEFSTECANKIYPKISWINSLKLCVMSDHFETVVYFVRDRLQWAFKITLDLMVKITFPLRLGHTPPVQFQ